MGQLGTRSTVLQRSAVLASLEPAFTSTSLCLFRPPHPPGGAGSAKACGLGNLLPLSRAEDEAGIVSSVLVCCTLRFSFRLSVSVLAAFCVCSFG